MTVTAEILRLPPPAPIKWQDPSLRVSQKSQTASQQQQAFTAPAHGETAYSLEIASAPFMAQVMTQMDTRQGLEQDIRLYSHPGFSAYRGAESLLTARAPGFSTYA